VADKLDNFECCRVNQAHGEAPKLSGVEVEESERRCVLSLAVSNHDLAPRCLRHPPFANHDHRPSNSARNSNFSTLPNRAILVVPGSSQLQQSLRVWGVLFGLSAGVYHGPGRDRY